MSQQSSELVTELLRKWQAGDQDALHLLIPLVYKELRRLAHVYLRNDEALNELSKLDSQQGQIVELRFFGGLSIEETSQVMGISPATIKRHWATARAWLRREMSKTARA